MNISSLLKELHTYEDQTYKQFHSKLGVNVPLIGVRTPILQSIAKRIIKEQPINYLDHYQKTCYETDVIYGFVLGGTKLPYQKSVTYLNHLANLIDNWATCDLTASRQKWIKQQKEPFIQELHQLWNTKQPWKQRFVYVLLLDYYLEETYLDLIFSFCEQPYEQEYYVQMAIAWLLSIALIKYPKQTEQYLYTCSLDNFTYNKTLQKAKESSRISANKKKQYQMMKR